MADLLPLARDFKAGYDRWADALDRCHPGAVAGRPGRSDPGRARPAALGHRVDRRAVEAVLSPFERAMLHPSLHNISDCLGP